MQPKKSDRTRASSRHSSRRASKALIAPLALFFVALTMIAAPQTAEALDFDFGVGISFKGGVQMSGTPEEDKATLDGQRVNALYPGFFGVGYGVGGFIEARFINLVGLELGFTYEESEGEGDINERTMTISTEDLIVSLHARVVTPGEIARFMFGIGPEFVVPMGADISDEVNRPFQVEDERDITTYLGLAIGAEIDAVYVRIPIEIRYRVNPGFGDTYDNRLTSNGTFKPNWQHQGLVMVGLQYYLDVWSMIE